MISQYSNPRDIDREFWEDYHKAHYWLKRKTSGRDEYNKILESGWAVFIRAKDYCFSDVYYYTSPNTGNRWMMWVVSKRDEDGEMHLYSRAVLYYFTEAYMTIMIPITTVMENREGEQRGKVDGVNIYTAHMFQRMADPDRLGVDMSDRVKVIRNFVESVATGWSDTRPPREGEKHTQIMLRLPASWIRGHTIMVDNRHVTIYRTFWTDKSMSYKQLKDVRSFTKFADAKMNEK